MVPVGEIDPEGVRNASRVSGAPATNTAPKTFMLGLPLVIVKLNDPWVPALKLGSPEYVVVRTCAPGASTTGPDKAGIIRASDSPLTFRDVWLRMVMGLVDESE
jgi:hypothetical protein